MNLEKLIRGRIDVTLVPGLAARYLIKEIQIGEKVFISPQPHQIYTRQILVQPQLKNIYRFLSAIVSKLPTNNKWQLIQEKYGFK